MLLKKRKNQEAKRPTFWIGAMTKNRDTKGRKIHA